MHDINATHDPSAVYAPQIAVPTSKMDPKDFVKSQRQQLPMPLSREGCDKKTCIVTGANSGLGFECAKQLVEFGCARVILAVRSIDAGEAAKDTIQASSGRKGVVHVWHLDLCRAESVKAFARRVERELDRVDGLLLNAGINNAKWEEFEGIECNIKVNIVSNVLLIALLHPVMASTAAENAMTTHVTVVGTLGAFSLGDVAASLPTTNVLDYLLLKERWQSDMDKRYIVSKLLLHWSVRELAKRLPVAHTGVALNIVNPGLCKTNLIRNSSLMLKATTFFCQLLLGRSAEVGSRAILYGVVAGLKSHGKYLSECQIRENIVPEWMTSQRGEAQQQQIWSELEGMLDKFIPDELQRLLHSSYVV